MDNTQKEKIKEDKTGTFYWTKKEPRKSMATYQRNQNKLMVNMLNVMDRKAAIMIRINTTLISGVVVFFDYISQIKGGALIGIVLVICCFISLILSVLAAKPPITKFTASYRSKILSKYPQPKYNLFMVGMTRDMDLQAYETAYDELVNNQELQIGNQIRLQYVMETELRTGFKILEFAYNAFIVGFVFTVLVFIITNLLDFAS
ncbi:MAG: Pycsar system effector family protein [Bacteroidota bacterium]